jgi:predicted nucleic acid-binding Zn ribbon protein
MVDSENGQEARLKIPKRTLPGRYFHFEATSCEAEPMVRTGLLPTPLNSHMKAALEMGQEAADRMEWVSFPRGSQYHRVYPMGTHSLLREFAELRTGADITAFMRRYGWLGHSDSNRVYDPSAGREFIADPLNLWRNESRAFRFLWRMWRAVTKPASDDRAFLRRYINLDDPVAPTRAWLLVPDDDTEFRHQGCNIVPYYAEVLPGLINERGIQPMSAAARLFVEYEVNRTLAKHSRSAVSLGNSKAFENPELITQPCCLLGAIYLVFAFEMTGRMLPKRQCEVCGNEFALTRADKKVCNRNCRTKKSRRFAELRAAATRDSVSTRKAGRGKANVKASQEIRRAKGEEKTRRS